MKLTDEVQAKLIAGIAEGLPVTIACAHAGVSHTAFYKLKRRDPDFAAAVDRANAQRVVALTKGLKEAGKDEWRSYAWMLERTSPEFRPRMEVQHQVQQGVQRVFEELADHMSEAAYAELTRGLALLVGLEPADELAESDHGTDPTTDGE